MLTHFTLLPTLEPLERSTRGENQLDGLNNFQLNFTFHRILSLEKPELSIKIRTKKTNQIMDFSSEIQKLPIDTEKLFNFNEFISKTWIWG